MAKKSHFLAQNSVFGARMVTGRGPYHFLRVLDSKNRVLHSFGANHQGFRSQHHQKTVFFAKNKHVWLELYKSCYSQLGGECHISRIRPILDGIKPALSIWGWNFSNLEGGGGGLTPENMLFMV